MEIMSDYVDCCVCGNMAPFPINAGDGAICHKCDNAILGSYDTIDILMMYADSCDVTMSVAKARLSEFSL